MSENNESFSQSNDEAMDLDDNGEECEPQVFNPKIHKLNESEELEMDESAYVLYQNLKVEHSCLSFDIIEDHLGSGEQRGGNYPYTVYAVTGSQASAGHSNILTVMKMSNLNKLKNKEPNDSDDDSDDNESNEEFLDHKSDLNYVNISQKGGVNRVRTHQFEGNTIAASWSDMGQVHIWDLKNELWAVNDSAYMSEYLSKNEIVNPFYTVRSHSTEGFAIDWSRCKSGQLASGDNNGNIFITIPKQHGFETISKPLQFHKSSVEDIQWSPNQDNIVISCSSDRSIVVWDTRDMKNHIIMNEAHSQDINVVSWSRNCAFSMVSGGDDGLLKVWDLRMCSGVGNNGQSAYTHLYDYHKDCPITSIEWCPQSQYVFAASSEDDQLTLWDISMEQDTQENTQEVHNEYPTHLLFNHMGQKEIKELHWHPQIPGLIMSTALDGINVFKTISV